MNKSNKSSRMTKSDKKSKRNQSPKRVLRRNGRGDKDDDDSSVDSKGNIKGLIDYDYTSDDESISSVSTPSRGRSPVPKRKAAIIARKKIKKEISKLSPKSSDNSTTKHTQLKTKTNRRLTPTKRKSPFPIQPKHKRRSIGNNSAFKLNKKNDNKIKKKKKYEESESEEEEYESEEEEYESEEDEYDSEEDEYESEEDEYDSESEEEDDEESEDEEEDEDEEEYDGEYDEEDKSNKQFGGIILTLGGGMSNGNDMRPKKYNMKKEPEIVKKFVKLLTEPVEENTIDKQIEQFKALNNDKQKELLLALENRPTTNDSGIDLMLKILTLKLPPDVQGMILSKYNSLQSLDTSSNEYFKLRAWLDKVVSIPFGIYKDIPIRLEDGNEKCAEFMRTAKKYLDDSVYGQDESKLQIMQFISTKISNPEHRGLSLLFVGPPGIGKTTIIKNGIAKALEWPFQFISLGGDSDASTYTGHQMVYESSHCGKIVNSLVASKSMSTVLMFDEIDKISQTPKGEEVMNLLIHLTDPVQNGDFEDKYLAGVPIDLSKVMFVFSANDINKIDKVLLDRMMVIDLKGYDLKQKTAIAEQYLLPSALKEVNLNERVSISKDILTHIIQEYANEEKGVRELKRCIEQITQKINMLRMFNSPDLPFHIKNFSLPFIVKPEHIKLFLKKKENHNAPPPGMYI
jgi:ATP-dependent Lon protease